MKFLGALVSLCSRRSLAIRRPLSCAVQAYPSSRTSKSGEIKTCLRNPSRKMSYCSWRGEEHYRDHFDVGTYVCSECSHPLFTSRSKYEHSSPWPAFTETLRADSLKKVLESPGALKVSCGKCGNPLGHEFLKDGPDGKSRF